ncbi:MAG: hypothetical protein ACKVWV_15820 [Planctomycetota bacterium]
MVRHPALELTVAHPAEGGPRVGNVWEREAWLGDAWVVATEREPGERVEGEVVSRERLAVWMPRVRDEIVAGRRTMLFDGEIDQRLVDGGWLSFVVGDRVVGSTRVVRGMERAVFDFDEGELARGLGALVVRVVEVARDEVVPGARIELWESSARTKRPFAHDGLGPSHPELEVPRIVAGEVILVVDAPGRERRVLAVDVRPGRTTRADVRLAVGAAASGTVVDEVGRGVEIELEVVPFDLEGGVLRSKSTRRAVSARDGGFRFWDLGPALWFVRSCDERLAFAARIIDTRTGDVGSVRLEARAGTPVRFLRQQGTRNEEIESFEVRDEHGFVVLERRGGSIWRDAEVLLPGRHSLRAVRSDGSVLERELLVDGEPVLVPLE